MNTYGLEMYEERSLLRVRGLDAAGEPRRLKPVDRRRFVVEEDGDRRGSDAPSRDRRPPRGRSDPT